MHNILMCMIIVNFLAILSFSKKIGFFPDFHLFFLEMLFLILQPLVFARPNHGRTHQTSTFFTRDSDQHIYKCVDSCDVRLDLEKHVFWGEKRHDREKCIDLETQYQTACDAPRLHESAQILRLEFRTVRFSGPIQWARGNCALKRSVAARL